MDVYAAQIAGKRDYQEDAYRVVKDDNNDHTICLLADGMGGHAAGDVAANLSLDTFVDELSGAAIPAHESFLNYLDQSNRALKNSVVKNPKQAGMGCTFVAVEFFQNVCSWISIGDSPLFHIRGDEINRINADHSMAAQLDSAARRGEITQEEAQNSSSRNVLLSALTGEKINRVDFKAKAQHFVTGDVIILGSDGIETLELAEIVQIANQNDGASSKQICKFLLQRIDELNKPHQDNATAIVIKITDKKLPYLNKLMADDDIRTKPIFRS